jgi:Glyoxalase-like domain
MPPNSTVEAPILVHHNSSSCGRQRVLALGATRLPSDESHFRVYADPTGHPFCLEFASRRSGFDSPQLHRFSHCANRSLWGRFRWWGGCGPVGGGGLGDAEDGDEPVGCGDGDVGDEGFDEGFALVDAAGVDDVGDVVGDVGECGWAGGGGVIVEGEGEFVVAGAELLGLVA